MLATWYYSQDMLISYRFLAERRQQKTGKENAFDRHKYNIMFMQKEGPRKYTWDIMMTNYTRVYTRKVCPLGLKLEYLVVLMYPDEPMWDVAADSRVKYP